MNTAFKQRRIRIGALTFTLAALFGFAVIRLVVLVALYGPRLNSLAQQEHTGESELAPVRGPIVDRNGEPLAMSAETQSVYARPKKVLESSTPAERGKLAAILMMVPISLEQKLDKQAPFVWLERRMSPDKAQAIEALGIDGIGTISEYKRFYPESNLAASVVGLSGMDGQGLSGLELRYDKIARGEAVELSFDHDAQGHPIFDSPMALKAPEPGAQLELTIDSRIQSLAETELAAEVKASGAKRGSVIVIDPFTGEVMAMANVSASGANVHDRLHNPAQTLGAFPMLVREIANNCSRDRIARSQLLEYHVLLRMMVGIGIDLEIGDDRPENLVIRPLCAIKDAQLLLKNEEQLFDVAMFLAQKIDNHRFDPTWIPPAS